MNEGICESILTEPTLQEKIDIIMKTFEEKQIDILNVYKVKDLPKTVVSDICCNCYNRVYHNNKQYCINQKLFGGDNIYDN